jgi:cell division protein FtsB
MFRDTISRAGDLFNRGRRLAIFALLCALIASFAHQAVKGDHGLERRALIKQRIVKLEAERDRLATKHAALKRDVALLRAAEHTPTDLAEEQVRSLLNLARDGEIIVLQVPRAAD